MYVFQKILIRSTRRFLFQNVFVTIFFFCTISNENSKFPEIFKYFFYSDNNYVFHVSCLNRSGPSCILFRNVCYSGTNVPSLEILISVCVSHGVYRTKRRTELGSLLSIVLSIYRTFFTILSTDKPDTQLIRSSTNALNDKSPACTWFFSGN